MPTNPIQPPTLILQREFDVADLAARVPNVKYVIKGGDTFSSVAAKLGTTVGALEAANPALTPESLQIGDAITVPGTFFAGINPNVTAPANETTFSPHQTSNSAPTQFVPSQAAPTHVAFTQDSPPQAAATQSASTTYVVVAGDTFSSISTKYGTTVSALQSANPTVTSETLQIGQIIVVTCAC